MTPVFSPNDSITNIIPKPKQLTRFIAWIKGLLSQAERLSTIFYWYINGYYPQDWDILGGPNGGYQVDDDVVYNKRIYRCIYPSLGEIPDKSPFSWILILDDFIGSLERSKYTFQKVVIEYALNRFFQKELTDNGFVGFKQPPLISDIYITNDVPAFGSFLVFETERRSDNVYQNTSSQFVLQNSVFTSASSYKFIVHVPDAVYGSFGTAQNFETILHNFLDKYIPCGITFTIDNY